MDLGNICHAIPQVCLYTLKFFFPSLKNQSVFTCYYQSEKGLCPADFRIDFGVDYYFITDDVP